MWQTLLGAALAAVMSLGPVPPTDQDVSSGAPPTRAVADGQRFWVKDTHRYTSPWYAGARRKMINYGCTPAPYYAPDPRCAGDRGFHHGLDVAMPCGTRLFAGFRGWVVRPASSGSLGAAYGGNAFRLRNHRQGIDVVIGHVRRVYVEPGDRVRKGQLVARASDAAAPDGCHLHIEVRPVGAGYQSAVRPHPYLNLRRR
jgi:murein DD-endopeptidase MepM/ murein hydrolase activator NlpD